MSAEEPAAHEITLLLEAWRGGDERAFDALIPVIFDDLRRLARHYFLREAAGSTLEPTAVVHEVYLRLVNQPLVHFTDRSHFFGVASRLVRQVLVDHARSRAADKRGGDQLRQPLDEAIGDGFRASRMDTALAVHEVLGRLRQLDERKARLVELRYFCGLTVPEAAEVLGISRATAERDWTFARRWLAREISAPRGHAQPPAARDEPPPGGSP